LGLQKKIAASKTAVHKTALQMKKPRKLQSQQRYLLHSDSTSFAYPQQGELVAASSAFRSILTAAHKPGDSDMAIFVT